MEKITAQPADNRIYNSRIVDNYIRLLEQKYSHVDLKVLLDHANMTPYQVRDEGHWFTQEQINLFHEGLQHLTGNHQIAYEAGAFSASAGAMGIMRRYMLTFIGPIKIYEKIAKWSKNFSRSSCYESKKISPTTVELTVTPYPGIREREFQCLNRLGYLEGISRLFGNFPPHINHTQCLFRGDDCCRYVVSFPATRSSRWHRIRHCSYLGLFVILVVALGNIHAGLFPLLLVSAGVSLTTLIGWYSEHVFSLEFQEAANRARDSTDELIEQININYNNALLVNETARALYGKADIDGVLQEVITVLQKHLEHSRVLIFLANDEKSKLLPAAGFGYSEGQLDLIANWPGFRLDQEESREIVTRSYKEQKPFLINDCQATENIRSEHGRIFFREFGITSFLCCPLLFEDQSLGVLAVDKATADKPLLERDLNLLMGVARQIGVALYHIRLESRIRQVQKIEAISTLAKGITHDFNNILNVIFNYADLAGLQAAKGMAINDHIKSIKMAGYRAKDLVEQILTFSCSIEQECKMVDLPLVIAKSLESLRTRIPDNIRIQQRIDKDCRPVLGDETQIYKVISNICLNAIQSMEGRGGVLTIALTNQILLKHDADMYPDLVPGEYIQLRIGDTGHGMSSEVMERIFEPYFTTKPKGEGSGIGLAVVHGIMKKHGGTVTVTSRPEEGSMFQLLFPYPKGQQK